MTFLQDLAVAQEVEKEFSGFLQARGYTTGLNTSTTVTEKRFYDLWAQLELKKLQPLQRRLVTTFEIKFDRRVKETKKVYIEQATMQNSRADYIVYKLDSDGKFYIHERPFVLSLLDSNSFESKKGGDSWGPGIVVPEEQFKQLFLDAEIAFPEVVSQGAS